MAMSAEAMSLIVDVLFTVAGIAIVVVQLGRHPKPPVARITPTGTRSEPSVATSC